MSVQRDKKAEDRYSLRQFQLARASRETVAREANYRRLRLRELEVMCKIAQGEVEEVEARLKMADIKLAEARPVLCSSGTYTEEDLNTLPTTNPPFRSEHFSDVKSNVSSDDSHSTSIPAGEDG